MVDVSERALRIPGLGGWDDDPLWAHFYDWSVEHRRLGGLAWRLGIQSDLQQLYAAAAEIGRQPAGARVLDIPCGGGVALRGLKPGQGVEYVAADIAQTMLDRTIARPRSGVASPTRCSRRSPMSATCPSTTARSTWSSRSPGCTASPTRPWP